MVINISFANKSLQVFSHEKNKINLSSLESLTQKNYESNLEEDETLAGELNNQDNETNDEILGEAIDEVSDENLTNEVQETSNTQIINLDFGENDAFRLKFDELQDASLETFSNRFAKNELGLSAKLINQIKLEKQFLVLPDELVFFDFVVVPNLNPWRSVQSFNLKLSVDYKDSDKLNKKYKMLNKVKPNSVYAVQFTKPEIAKRFTDYFSQNGIKVKGVNFYSNCLCNFYSSHIRGAKNASIVVKVTPTQTTILAIVRGFVVATETLRCGERELFKNSTYKFDEYSKRSISHKFVCYSVSKVTGSTGESKKSDEKLTREQIEKTYSKNKTNSLAPNFQPKSINIADLIRKKIDDMILFLQNSDLHINIEKIFVDVKNDETFAKLKLKNAVKVYYPERDIFRSNKSTELFKTRLLSSNSTNKGILGGGLWKKTNKKQ